MAQYPHLGFQQPQIAVVQTELGDSPVRTVCPNCRNEVLTATTTECSVVQHIAFFVMCITGICAICSCVPYCCSSLGNVRHECPHCHTHLGSYRQCKWKKCILYKARRKCDQVSVGFFLWNFKTNPFSLQFCWRNS